MVILKTILKYHAYALKTYIRSILIEICCSMSKTSLRLSSYGEILVGFFFHRIERYLYYFDNKFKRSELI